MNITSRLAPLALLAALIAIPSQPAAGEEKVTPQACPPAGCDPGDPGTTTHTSTLTVTTPATGKIASNTVNGHAIDCGSACSVVDTQVTEDVERPTTGWFTYTLTASGGPSGYSASWSGASGCGVGPTCVVTNDQPSTNVSVAWVDTSPPTVLSISPGAVGPANGFTVSAATTYSGSGVQRHIWTVDSVQQATWASSLYLGGFSDGTHTVTVRAQDYAGNVSGAVTRDVVVDRVAPALTVEALPAFVTSPPTLTFATAEQGVTHTCRVTFADAAGPVRSGCTSPWTVAPSHLAGSPAELPDGTYALRVVSTDPAGNTTTTDRVTTLDRVDPVLEIVDGPAEGSSVVADTTSVRFTLAETNPDLLTCTLDDAPVSGCDAGTDVTLSGLTDGAHVFEVVAVDKAGHTATVTRSFHRQRHAVPLSAQDAATTYGRAGVLWATGLGTAEGTVQFATGARVLCNGLITGGGASCEAPARLDAGRYTVAASYAGSGTHAPATDSLVLTVRKARARVTASAARRSTVEGKRVRLTARVAPGAAPGTVVFRHGREVLCRAKVRSGVATCATSARLRPDSYRVVAHYLGSRNYSPAKDGFGFKVTARR